MYFEQHKRKLDFNLNFINVQSGSPAINTYWDGFIGIAPLRAAGAQNSNKNFLFQLKEQGKIDHMTISFYVREHSGNYSSVKFGSYDASGIAPGTKMAIYRTRENVRWTLTVNRFAVNSHTPLSQVREMEFDFSLPYLYVPTEEFKEFTTRMSSWDLNLRCDTQKCKY